MANVATVGSIAALQSLATSANAVTYLSAAGREGDFLWKSGNFSAQVASDPQTGIYVPSSATPSSSGCWVRAWDGVNGRPEWFGAVTGAGLGDTRTAINACIALCPVTQFSDADYFFQDTFNFNTGSRRLVGVRGDGSNTGRGTRLILTGANAKSATVCLVGPSTDPMTIAAYTSQLEMEGLSFFRDLSVSGPVNVDPSGLSQKSVAGIMYRYIQDCKFAYINSVESPVGHNAQRVINSKWDYWYAFRMTQGAGTPVGGVVPNDVFVGFDAGGDSAAPTVIGSNASIYIGQGLVSCTPQYPYSAGVKLWGYCADTLVGNVETTVVTFGVVVDGRDTSGTAVTNTYAHQDIRIQNVVADAVHSAGVYLAYTNAQGLISVDGLYAAPQGTGAAVTLDNALAATTIASGKAPCVSSTAGIRAVLSSGFSIKGFNLRDAGTPIILDRCHSYDIEAAIYNSSTGSSAAASLTNCFRGTLKPIVNGVAGAFSSGISIDSATNNAEFNGSGINQGCFTTVSAAYKVRFNGADASSGTGATAFQAAGNVLSGVKS